jgi:hypothetical protein
MLDARSKTTPGSFRRPVITARNEALLRAVSLVSGPDLARMLLTGSASAKENTVRVGGRRVP